MDNNQSVASELVREFALFEGKRGIWENHWEEVAQRVLPHYSTTFYQQGNTTPGQKRTKEQYDVTANSALWKFAAAMESMLTPANSKWHKVRVPNKALMQLPDVRLWCDTVAEIMFYYRYSPHSGFQGNMHDSYVSLGAFGTSCLFIDEFNDPTMPDIKGLRYRHVPLGEVFFAANHQGQVDKVYRRFKMTLRQIAQKWGLNALPEGYRQRAVDKPDDELMVLHIVKPRSETTVSYTHLTLPTNREV